MDYSLPGSSVHGILQARILEWAAIPSSRGSPQPTSPVFPELAGSGKPEVIDFIFILHFNFIFNLLTNVYILLYLFLPSHLITAHRNVIALWALLQSSPPEEESFTMNLTLNSPPSLLAFLPLDEPRSSIFLEMPEIQGKINLQSLPLGDRKIL